MQASQDDHLEHVKIFCEARDIDINHESKVTFIFFCLITFLIHTSVIIYPCPDSINFTIIDIMDCHYCSL